MSRLRWQLPAMPTDELHDLEAEIEEEFVRRSRAPRQPEHVCGLQGFGREITDVCPGCVARSSTRK